MPTPTVIPKSELDRITNKVVDRPEVNPKREAAIALHRKSKERAKGWSNTLEGARKAAEAARSQRLIDEEEARRRIDETEAKLQLELRRDKIERANALLAKESDRVKTFSSAMMLSDVLAEREAQVRLKEELIKLERIRDEKYQDMMKHNYRTLLERELREKHILEQKSREMTLMQKQQLEESIQRRLDEIEDNLIEGDMIRVKAAEDDEAEKKKQAERRAAATLAVKETLKANEYLKELKTRETRRNLRETVRIAEYAKMKDEMSLKIKQRENELFEQKQQVKQRMIDRQAAEMEKRLAEQNKHLAKEIAQKEEADNVKFLEKEAKMAAWKKSLEESRQQQIQRKLEDAENQRQADARAIEIQTQMFARLEKDEHDEKNERKAACLRLAKEQLHQIDMQKARARQEQINEVKVVQRAKQAILTDLTSFHEYAETIIKEYASDGKNVIPLIKELRNYKKHLAE